MPTIPTQIEKCRGAMLATAIGDALGWPNEPQSKNQIKRQKVKNFFIEWTRRCKEPCWHNEEILPGEYSDDTQMTLSVARSIIAGDWEKFFAEKELPFWLRYERGGGGSLLKAARSISNKKVLLWRSDFTKGYFNAGGNGAAMRILPHVIAGANKADVSALMVDVIKDTLITHGHPRAFLGATCYAYALDYLLRKDTMLEYGELVSAVIDGQQFWSTYPKPGDFGDWLNVVNQYSGFNYIEEWGNVRTHMLRQLEFIRASLNKGLMLDDFKTLTELGCFSSVRGAGDVTVLASLYLASKYASNPVLGIRIPAFSFNADTDTIASITGGLLGMLCGTNWIPAEWRVVQDFDCLIRMTELLLSDDKKAATRAEMSNLKGQENGWRSSPIGKIRFLDLREYSVKCGTILIERWQTDLRQTIYMKKFQPLETRTLLNRGSENKCLNMRSGNMVSKIKQQSTLKQIAEIDFLQKSREVKNHERQFTLKASTIKELLDKPEFKGNITVGKTFKIIQAFIENDETIIDIAKRFDVNEKMVELLKMCIK